MAGVANSVSPMRETLMNRNDEIDPDIGQSTGVWLRNPVLKKEVRECVLRRPVAPSQALERLLPWSNRLYQVIGVQRQTRATPEFQCHGLTEPGNVVEVDHDHAVTPEASIEFATEGIGCGHQQTAAGRQVPRAKAKQGRRVIDMLDNVADEHNIEALAQIRLGGSVDTAHVVTLGLQVAHQRLEDVDTHAARRDRVNFP